MKPEERIELFELAGTPFSAEPSALVEPVMTAGLTLWLSGHLGWKQSLAGRLRLAMLAPLAYWGAVLVHYGGHVLSSLAVAAPADRVHVMAPAPLAVYEDNDVSPQAHRGRAIGGPIGSVLAVLVGALLRPLTRDGSPAQDFLKLSHIINLLLGLGSLLPLPFLDGGSILKWSLVEQGRTPQAAEQSVRETNLIVGAVAGVVGTSQAMQRRWLATALLAMVAIPCILTGLGKDVGR